MKFPPALSFKFKWREIDFVVRRVALVTICAWHSSLCLKSWSQCTCTLSVAFLHCYYFENDLHTVCGRGKKHSTITLKMKYNSWIMGTSNLHFKIKKATNVISNGWEVLVDNQTAQLEFACFDTVLNKLLQVQCSSWLYLSGRSPV